GNNRESCGFLRNPLSTNHLLMSGAGFKKITGNYQGISVPNWNDRLLGFSPQRFQIRNDRRIGPLHGPDKLASDNAFAVDDIRLRPARCAVRVAALLSRIIDGNEVY